MKPRLAITVVVVVGSVGYSSAAVGTGDPSAYVRMLRSDLQAVAVEFNMSSLESREVSAAEGTCLTFGLNGEGGTYEYGYPMLPAVSRFIIVPPDAGLELVVTSDEARRVTAAHPPLICSDPEQLELPLERRAWDGSLYPPRPVEMSDPVILRDVRIVRLTTYPVQYERRTNTYVFHDHLEAEIRYTEGPVVNPLEPADRPHRSRNFQRVLRSLVMNPDEPYRDNPDFPVENQGHCLVVTNQNCLRYVVPFIEWRRKSGWKMDILSLSDGDANNTSTIKNRIVERYQAYVNAGKEPFDMVLLVGDRAGYTSGSGSPQWQLAAPTGTSIWGSPPHDDWDYACIVGNDRYADVGISRWCAGSEPTLNLFTQRTLLYEATPNIQNPQWFSRGAAYSQHWGNSETSAWHITIHTNTRWAKELLEQKGFEDVRFYEDFSWDQQGQRVGPFERDQFNQGVSVLLGRAENYYWRSNFQGVNANTVFPLRLVLSGHGEWTCWNIMRNGGVEGGLTLKGAVASTCSWGGPQTYAMSSIWLELVDGVMNEDLPLGWARVKAVIAPEIYTPNFGSTYNHCKTDVDCYGDPGVQPWIGVPRQVEADLPSSLTNLARSVEISVHQLGARDVPISGAAVTVYANGNMPAPDNANYATYNDMIMITGYTDSDGRIRFVFDDNVRFLSNDTLFVTVTGRDIRPWFGSVRFTTPQRSVVMTGYTLSEVEGNGDDRINPGESWAVTVTAKNNGAADLEDVTAQVWTDSRWVTVEQEDDIRFGDVRQNQEVEGEGQAVLHISPGCPDGASRPATRPEIMVEFRAGDNVWPAGFRIDPFSPNLEVREVVGGIIVGTAERNLDISVVNKGRIAAPELQVRLTTLGIGVNVIRATSRYNGINVGGNARLAGEPFVVSGNSVVVPGLRNPMALIFSAGDNIIDTAFFELQVREPGRNMPQGPDKYGYVCFDDTDTDWDLAPEYDWVEIALRENNRDFNGTRISFPEDGDWDIGSCAVVELGFVTQFYGEEYNRITVATNGFIAMGDQGPERGAIYGNGFGGITNHQNWPMDRGIGGGVGMIAPFWDDLRLTNNSDVYYYRDDEEHRMIIEWYNMGYANNGNATATFQVIIFDKRYWITATGDPMIVFQYKRIANAANLRGSDGAWVNNTPYASVGISSPDGTTGINYTFNNVYPITSAQLQDRRALLFATSTQYFRAGYLHGRVYNAETGEPIRGATVYTSYGFSADTDADGYWFINDALAETRFNITAHKVFYNDSTYADTILAEADTLELNFGLLHPEFSASSYHLEAAVDSGLSTQIPFTVTNTGNGTLTWSVARRLPRGADVDPWHHRLSYMVGDSLRDSRIEGVAFANGLFYISGGDPDFDTLNYIYVMTPDMEVTNMFVQPGQSTYGLLDLEWDGELLWGSGDQAVYGFTTEGEVRYQWRTRERRNQAIAWDSDRACLWVSSISTGDIYRYDREGNLLGFLNRNGLRIFGLAYWPDDPDGYTLYTIDTPDLQDAGLAVVHKINPVTNDTMTAAVPRHPLGGQPRGIYITNEYDVYSWVFMHVANQGSHDRIDIWQLDARRDWFVLDVDEGGGWIPAQQGEIYAGEQKPFLLILNTANLPKLTFEAFLWFTHNAAGYEDIVNVRLEVIGPEPPSAFNLLTPADGDTLDSLGVVQFVWEPSYDRNAEDRVTYMFWLKNEGDSIAVASEEPQLSLDLRTLEFEAGYPSYGLMEWWVQALSGPDTVMSMSRFGLHAPYNGVGAGRNEPPVVFGLHSVYPSPFNTRTVVRVGVDRAERVRLLAYDIRGRLAATIMDAVPTVGYHSVVWDAGALPSGLYVLRLESAGRTRTAKVALVR